MNEDLDRNIEKRDLFGALKHRSFDESAKMYQMAGFSVSIPHLQEPRNIFNISNNNDIQEQKTLNIIKEKENENEKVFTSSSSFSSSDRKNELSLLSILSPNEYTKAVVSLNQNEIGIFWSVDKVSWILCDALKGFSSDLVSLGPSKTASICLPGYTPICTRTYFHEFWKLFVLRIALDTSCKAFMTAEADRGQRALASTLSDMLVYFDASLTFLQSYIKNRKSEISLSWLWICTKTHRNLLWEWFRCIASENVIRLVADAVDSDFLLGSSGFHIDRIIGSHELMDINYWLQYSYKEWNLLQHLMEYMERHHLGSQTTHTFHKTSDFAMKSCSTLLKRVSIAVLKDIETVIFKWNLDPLHDKISIEEMVATLRVTSKSIWVNANNQKELLEQLLAALLWARTRVYIVNDSTFLNWLEDDEHLSFQMDGLDLALPIPQAQTQQMQQYTESTRVKCDIFNQRISLAIDLWDTPEELSLVRIKVTEIEEQTDDDASKADKDPIVEDPSNVSDSVKEKKNASETTSIEKYGGNIHQKNKEMTEEADLSDSYRTLVSGPAISAVIDSSLIKEAKEMLKQRYNKAIVEAERRATLAHWKIMNRPQIKERRSMLSNLYLNESKAWSMRMAMNLVDKDATFTVAAPSTDVSTEISKSSSVEDPYVVKIPVKDIDKTLPNETLLVETPVETLLAETPVDTLLAETPVDTLLAETPVEVPDKTPVEVPDETPIMGMPKKTSTVETVTNEAPGTQVTPLDTPTTVMATTESNVMESIVESQVDTLEAPMEIAIEPTVAVELPDSTHIEITTESIIEVPIKSTEDILSPSIEVESPPLSTEEMDLQMQFRDSVPHLNWSEIMEDTGSCVKSVLNMLDCAFSNTINTIPTSASKHDDANNTLSLIESKSMIAQVVEAKCYFLDIATMSYLVIDKGLLNHVNIIEDSFLLSRRSSFIFDFSVTMMESFCTDNTISPQDSLKSADVLCTRGLWSQSNVRRVLTKLGHLDTIAWIDINEEIVDTENSATRKTTAKDYLFSFEGLDRLMLIYRCAWPINVVFGEDIFQKITTVTRRLLQLLQLKWLSNFIWQKIRATQCNNRDIFCFFQRIQHNIQAIIEFTHDCIRSLQIKFRKDLRNDMYGGVANFIHKLHAYIESISASVFVSMSGRLSTTLDALLHDTLTVLSIIDKYLDHQCDLLDLTERIQSFQKNKLQLTKILLREVNEELDENIVASINSLIIRLDTFHT